MSESKTSESLPGDADQASIQAQAQGDGAVTDEKTTDAVPTFPTPKRRTKRKSEEASSFSSSFDDKDPVDPGDDKDPVDPQPDKGNDDDKRGELSPAQFEDDGWGDTPVQMRG